MYSVQRIKFDCLAYIREFGADASVWHVGVRKRPREALAEQGVDQERDVWIWKPAASPTAARAVRHFLVDRMRLRPMGEDDADGHCVVLYRKIAPR